MLSFVVSLVICFAVTGKVSISMVACIFSAGFRFASTGRRERLSAQTFSFPGMCWIENCYAPSSSAQHCICATAKVGMPCFSPNILQKRLMICDQYKLATIKVLVESLYGENNTQSFLLNLSIIPFGFP